MSIKIALFNVADFVNKSRFSSLGLAYIASYLRKYSGLKDIHIIEGDGARKLKQIRPDLIGIYSVTQMFNEACALAGLIKATYKDVPIITGGYHISALPHTLPACFDVGVLGEGEETTRELVEIIRQREELKPEKLAGVNGIAFHVGGKVKINPARPFIEDIDTIPFPARDLMVNRRFSNIITSRGCPYRCVFCASVNFWKKPRFHSAPYVINEIEEIITKYKAVHISIWDDLFIADRQRFESICRLIRERGINKKVSFGCALRSNLVDDELCRLLKSINVRRLSIGFETGSQKVLDYLKCGSVTVEQHVKTVALCKSHGFFITGTFMVGSPEETKEDLGQTLELIKKLKLTGGGSITLAAPLPGTLLWEYAKKKQLVSDNMDYSRAGIMSADFSDPQGYRGVVLSDKVSKETVFQMAKEMQKESNRYYLKGLLHKDNFSLKGIRFIMARPGEVLSVIKFALKSLFGKASVMGRYAFYYKKL